VEKTSNIHTFILKRYLPHHLLAGSVPSHTELATMSLNKDADLDQISEILKLKGVEPNPHCPALPVFNLDSYLNSSSTTSDEDVQNLCAALAFCLRESGAIVIRDPRCDERDNEQFLDLMERYFSQSIEDKMKDVHPELMYQVGATPEFMERPRCLRDQSILEKAAANLPVEDQPSIPSTADAKWRFFWRVGERPKHFTRFAELNAEPVIPAAFPEWSSVMDSWGYKLLDSCHTVSEMLALGLGLDKDAFTQRMRLGAHLLAPTGAELDKHGLGTVFAGYHYDLNFLTIHGKSRYPGLYIWEKRNNKKVPVRIPEGALLVQAAKQLEWLTGGVVAAGYHEVKIR
jgi:isopenicillin N synthase-like dioxygenase